ALLQQYSDVAAELVEFFSDHDRMNGLTCPKPQEKLADQTAIHEPGTPRSSDATWRSTPVFDAATSYRIGQYEILEEIGRGGRCVCAFVRRDSPRSQTGQYFARAGRFELRSFHGRWT